jgi:hypothetical protein
MKGTFSGKMQTRVAMRHFTHRNNRVCKVFFPRTQQNRRPCTANGFALSPMRTVFSDGIVRVG